MTRTIEDPGTKLDLLIDNQFTYVPSILSRREESKDDLKLKQFQIQSRQKVHCLPQTWYVRTLALCNATSVTFENVDTSSRGPVEVQIHSACRCAGACK